MNVNDDSIFHTYTYFSVIENFFSTISSHHESYEVFCKFLLKCQFDCLANNVYFTVMFNWRAQHCRKNAYNYRTNLAM